MKNNKLIPRKNLGQNFLVDAKIIEKIIIALNINKDNCYLEIGPGQGALTLPVSKKTNKLIAVEIDQHLVDYLRPWLNKEVKLFNQDILKFNWDQYLVSNTTLFGNLPYYITTEILEKVFDYSSKIDSAIVMIQKDVASKIVDNSSGKDMSYLALLINYVFDVEVVTQVSKNSFDPKPTVDSTVLKLIPRKILNSDDLVSFRIALVGLLKQRRKTIFNNLKAMSLDDIQLNKILNLVNDKNTRVESLTPALVYQIVEKIIKVKL